MRADETARHGVQEVRASNLLSSTFRSSETYFDLEDDL
jgi:hypothetical protein